VHKSVISNDASLASCLIGVVSSTLFLKPGALLSCTYSDSAFLIKLVSFHPGAFYQFTTGLMTELGVCFVETS
jgi:hypothetical protein